MMGGDVLTYFSCICDMFSSSFVIEIDGVSTAVRIAASVLPEFL